MAEDGQQPLAYLSGSIGRRACLEPVAQSHKLPRRDVYDPPASHSRQLGLVELHADLLCRALRPSAGTELISGVDCGPEGIGHMFGLLYPSLRATLRDASPWWPDIGV